jgi:hypothetical protein
MPQPVKILLRLAATSPIQRQQAPLVERIRLARVGDKKLGEYLAGNIGTVLLAPVICPLEHEELGWIGSDSSAQWDRDGNQ